MTGTGFDFKIGQIVGRWKEEHDGVTWYYVEHIRNGRTVLAYSNYADPLDSYASPLERASPSDTSTASPFVSKRSDP